MTKSKRPVTASELMARLQNDPQFVARKKNQEKKLEENSLRFEMEERPLLTELSNIGWNVKSVWDFVNISVKYTDAIPVLLKHLLLPYSDRTLDGIARALAIPESINIWPILVSEYCNASIGVDKDGIILGFKDGLACALSAAANDSVIEELVMLVKDRKHGNSRMLLLPALKKSTNIVAKKALLDLEDDPDLQLEISS